MKTTHNYIALYHLARQLHGQTAAEQMQTLINKAAETCGAQQACLALLNPDQTLRAAYALDTRDAPVIWDALLDRGLAGYVQHAGRTIVVRNIARDPRWALGGNPISEGSAVGLPLYDQGEVFGVMLLIHPTLDHFQRDQVDMLEEIAAIASEVLPHALQAAHTRYHDSFENVAVPMILIDYDGVISASNREMCALLGCAESDLVGRAITEVHRGRPDELRPERLRLLQEGHELTFRTAAQSCDGELFPVMVRLRAIMLDGTAYIQLIEQDLSAQMEIDQLRSDLAAMVYHDLRGPLQTIQIALQKLGQVLANHESDAVRIMLQTGIRSSRQLSRMIDSLLDIQRLEQGHTILNSRQTELRAVLSDAAQLVQPLVIESGMSLRFEFPDTLPEVTIDDDMILRVVTNLLENAIKHTHPGGVIVLRANVHHDRVIVSVRDSGPGVPDAMKTQIFDKFSRVRHQNAPKGVGLGLAFCKLAIEAHGGTIWVEDAPGMGSAFTFSLPYKAEPELKVNG